MLKLALTTCMLAVGAFLLVMKQPLDASCGHGAAQRGPSPLHSHDEYSGGCQCMLGSSTPGRTSADAQQP